ncbi:uncharacterized protein LOC143653854 [Tamandua tetradactyla]|uniref:uncharacterized protein LOC143653854 n=1 Tax=Tamandua tetradactyla TaxID=48850 RepID=UPI004053EDF0
MADLGFKPKDPAFNHCAVKLKKLNLKSWLQELNTSLRHGSASKESIIYFKFHKLQCIVKNQATSQRRLPRRQDVSSERCCNTRAGKQKYMWLDLVLLRRAKGFTRFF